MLELQYPTKAIPFKVICTKLSHSVVKHTHGVNHAGLCLRTARDVELWQEVIGDCNQSILRPAGEPIHRTAADKTGELERSVAELLSYLWRTTTTTTTTTIMIIIIIIIVIIKNNHNNNSNNNNNNNNSNDNINNNSFIKVLYRLR